MGTEQKKKPTSYSKTETETDQLFIIIIYQSLQKIIYWLTKYFCYWLLWAYSRAYYYSFLSSFGKGEGEWNKDVYSIKKMIEIGINYFYAVILIGI